MDSGTKTEILGVDTKKPWESKTLWAGVIVALAPIFPPAQAVIASNPAIVMGLVGAVFTVLRMLSGKGKSGAPVSIKK
jgi:hypothetical protein